MLRSTQFISGAELDYIPVSGVVGEDVIRIQRNGHALKFRTTFDSNPVDVDVYEFNWLGLDTGFTLGTDSYILTILNAVTSFRTVIYEIGPRVGFNYVYLVKNGTQQAIYAAAPLDDSEAVRDGLEAAINAVTWTGFTVTTLALGTNRLRVTFSDTSDFQTFIGRTTYKAGYYCILDSEDYLIYYDDSGVAYPTLPALQASYDFTTLTLMPDGIETYLADPNTVPTYSETLEGIAAISGIPNSGTVPDQFAVIDTTNQRIYFWENLNIGEVIKVFQK